MSRRGLTSEELRAFEKDGFLIARNVLREEDFEDFERDYNVLIDAKARDLFERKIVKSTYADAPFDKRLALLAADCDDEAIENEIGPFGLSLDTMFALRKGFFEFMFKKRLLDAIQSIVGEEIVVSPIQHCRPFIPAREKTTQLRVGAATMAPWHQDQGVTLEEADRSEILTCWIPLTDVNVASGCRPLKVMRGAHTKGLFRHVKGDAGTTIDPTVLPKDAERVDATMNRGDILLMNRFCPHRSQMNTSTKVRWSLDLRFVKTGTPTGRPFWPALVVRSARDPKSEQRCYEEWVRRWKHDLEASKGKRWHRVVGDVGGSIGGVSAHDEKTADDELIATKTKRMHE